MHQYNPLTLEAGAASGGRGGPPHYTVTTPVGRPGCYRLSERDRGYGLLDEIVHSTTRTSRQHPGKHLVLEHLNAPAFTRPRT